MMKIKLSTDRLLSFTAITISICTLLVFSYQTHLIRQQQYASVLPYLEVGNYYSFTPEYKFTITNNGVGPAMIKSIEVVFKDSLTYESLIDYVTNHIVPHDSLDFAYSDLMVGKLLPADEEIPLLINQGGSESAKVLYDVVNNDSLEIIIEYESIYGQRWQILNDGAPVKK